MSSVLVPPCNPKLNTPRKITSFGAGILRLINAKKVSKKKT